MTHVGSPAPEFAAMRNARFWVRLSTGSVLAQTRHEVTRRPLAILGLAVPLELRNCRVAKHYIVRKGEESSDDEM